MQMVSFRVLLVEELREIYYSEALIAETFRRLSRNAHRPELGTLFEVENGKSAAHLKRLESIFELIHENPRGGRAAAVKAMLTEAEDLMGTSGERHVIDAGLILYAQRLNAWKLASYSGVAEWAGLLGHSDVVQLLRETLEDLRSGHLTLGKLAEDIGIEAKVAAS